MTSKRPTILVLMGGPDAERDVSLASGAAVAAALRAARRFATIDQVIERPTTQQLAAIALAAGADVIFPVLHGRWGEGGPLQEILEQIGLPYVGSGPDASRLAMNKLLTKDLLHAEGVQTPDALELRPDDECRLDPPLVLKPIDDGSSVDLRICRSDEEIDAARRALHPRRGNLLAERYIAGREMTVGVFEGSALPLLEIVPAVEFYDYDAKYVREDTRYVIDPEFDQSLKSLCCDIAVDAFHRLGCRDLARVDFMIDEDGAWFLELNTMPGFTSHSLVPMAARHIGLEMPHLCERLVDAAIRRVGHADPARTSSTSLTSP